MKKIKHLSLLIAAALIIVSISAMPTGRQAIPSGGQAQTEAAKPAAKTQPSGGQAQPAAAQTPDMLVPKTTLKMPPPTKLPAPTKPAQPAVPTGRQAADTKAVPVKPPDGVTK